VQAVAGALAGAMPDRMAPALAPAASRPATGVLELLPRPGHVLAAVQQARGSSVLWC